MPFVMLEALEARRLFAVPNGFEDVPLHDLNTAVASSMEFAPDGRLFIADSARGQIRIVKNGALLGTPALTLAVDHHGERGIQSLAFDPSFSSNKHLYVYYTKADPANPDTAPNNAVNRLVRYTMSSASSDTINPASAKVLVDNIPSPSGFHNGGALHFGADGMLYLGVGDGARTATPQDLNSLGGKVLRLNVKDGQPLIPADNPFAGQAGRRGEIWAYGFRNPFSGNVKPGTNTLFINDVGQNTWEEINDVAKGKNYGWPTAEGNSTNPAFTNPIYSYQQSSTNRAAISGGAFYAGTQFPSSYVGKYFFGDYVRRSLRVLDPATKAASDFGSNLTNVVDVDVAPDGTLYTLGVGGEVRRIRYTAGANRAPNAVASANPKSGLAPLTVSFSGAGSSDPDADALAYRWTFGDGTFANGRDVSHTYTVNGTYTAKLTVTDGRGGADDSSNLSIVVGNRAPTGAITAPASGAFYSGGQVISFSGTGSDPEDGTLPASAFTWSVVFHHAGHTHPFRTSIPGVKSGTFTIPRTGEFDANQFYRIHLTVKDSKGLTHTSFRDIKPRTTTFTLASNIVGAQLTLDSSPLSAPRSIVGVEGMTRTIATPASQTIGGNAYEFVSWSDGGARSHSITTPVNNTTYTATLRQVAATTLGATHDSYGYAGSPTANFGNATQLQVKKSSSGFARETYLKFDLSSVATINSAKLRLFGGLSAPWSSAIQTAAYGASNTTWTETGLTYNNRPASGATALSIVSISGTTQKYYEWDLTSYLNAEKLAGRNTVTIVLKNLQSGNPFTVFNSSEAATNKPQLVIT